MDFFDRQDRARRNTKLLVAYFVAGVALLIVAVYLAACLVFEVGSLPHRNFYYGEKALSAAALWNPALFSGVALGTLAVIAMGCLFKTAELARGGSAVATLLGGRPVNPSSTDPDERKLLDVVEEMAIAAGLPVPAVYLLPEEQGINAFAAGHGASDAVIAVTEGSLRLLSRDELQGVIGHEFSHILNGDMRLNLRLMGIIFGIVCLTVIGRLLLRTRGRRNPLPLLGLALLVVGWVGVLFGRLIQAAVSRQREFLADASAVQFTRNPEGLAGALKKIGGLSYGSRLKAAHAAEASHLFFSNGMGRSFLQLMETHPPLAERIRALEPGFDGEFPRLLPAEPAAAGPPASPKPQRVPIGLPAAGRLTVPPQLAAQAVLSNAGNPTTAHLRYAEELREALPPGVQSAAREPLGASTLVYALLLSGDEATRRKQVEELAGATSAGVVQETLRVLPEVQAVASRAKLPLVDLALPALRSLSPDQYRQFSAAVQALVESDGEIELFEYVVQKVVLRHLDPHFSGARKPIIQYYALKPLAPDCAILLSALAHLGQETPETIELAFQQGAQPLSHAAQVELRLVPAEQCELAQVDAALNRLAQAAPQIKKNLLNACAQTVAADGVIREMEAELLRAIADTLDCPLPPFVA
ncbi:MAG: M48 family metallopeptidase [Verrucomicrobiota bacterium]|jgi:Zn-dependent protease with chaperone function/uncharacterized tellurite resistance protein B-like protein